jgi:hypothetical protein
MKIFGPSLAKFKRRADKAKCAGDTSYRRAHFNADCVSFGESGDVENIFITLKHKRRGEDVFELDVYAKPSLLCPP